MKKTLGLLLLIALLVTVGCGSAGSNTSTSNETNSSRRSSPEQGAVSGKDLRALAAAEFEKALQSAHLESVSLAWSDNYIDYDPYHEVNDEVASLGSHETYERGLVHLKGTPLPGMNGNFVVAGDRVWWLEDGPMPDIRPFYKHLQGKPLPDPGPIPILGPFGYLDEAEKGNVIWVKTSYGRFKYRVYNKFITQPEDVSILESNNEEIVTLITCDDKFNPSGPIWNTCKRLVIQARLVSAEPR